MPNSHRALGQLVKETIGISDEQLDHALLVHRERNMPLGKVLVDLGYVTERDIARVLARQWGTEYVKIDPAMLDHKMMEFMPIQLMQQYQAIPLHHDEEHFTVGMLNPLDIYTIDQISIAIGHVVTPVVICREDYEIAIDSYRQSADSYRELKAAGAAQDGFEPSVEEMQPEEAMSKEALMAMVEDAPIVRLVTAVINQGLADRASDIHIQPEEKSLRVRYRIDGLLHDGMTVPKSLQQAFVSRIKVMADLDISEKRLPQDGRIGLTYQGEKLDFRVSSLPNAWGEKIVLRILRKASISFELSQLGFSEEMLPYFHRMITNTSGLVFVTGPTGSGKSTTLYGALNALNTPEKNILTVEDPIEYLVPGLSQTQMNPRAGLTFAKALRSILRQDPEIILVGETRDLETLNTAMAAAMTGHLVFSTLHTVDAPGAVVRLLEMGAAPYLVASSVIGVLAQRLVRVICPVCKHRYTPQREAIEQLKYLDDWQEMTFYRGAGCAQCRFTGYHGRLGVFELMNMTPAIHAMVLNSTPSTVLRHEALNEGMISMHQDICNKVRAGITTVEEGVRVVFYEA